MSPAEAGSRVMRKSGDGLMQATNTYSDKAEKCRRMAAKALTPAEKEDWLRLADDWAAMAAEFDPVSGALPWTVEG